MLKLFVWFVWNGVSLLATENSGNLGLSREGVSMTLILRLSLGLRGTLPLNSTLALEMSENRLLLNTLCAVEMIMPDFRRASNGSTRFMFSVLRLSGFRFGIAENMLPLRTLSLASETICLNCATGRRFSTTKVGVNERSGEITCRRCSVPETGFADWICGTCKWPWRV